MIFIIKIEIYGKHLQTKVEADNEFRTEQIVRKRLNIISIEEEVPENGPEAGFDFLKGMFGMK